MLKIELDGQSWCTHRDFFDALAVALGSVAWHGRNADAFLESMVYRLNLNRVQPPYKLVINDVSDLLRPYITDFASWVLEARDDRNTDPAWGDDVEVTVIVQ